MNTPEAKRLTGINRGNKSETTCVSRVDRMTATRLQGEIALIFNRYIDCRPRLLSAQLARSNTGTLPTESNGERDEESERSNASSFVVRSTIKLIQFPKRHSLFNLAVISMCASGIWILVPKSRQNRRASCSKIALSYFDRLMGRFEAIIGNHCRIFHRCTHFRHNLLQLINLPLYLSHFCHTKNWQVWSRPFIGSANNFMALSNLHKNRSGYSIWNQKM